MKSISLSTETVLTFYKTVFAMLSLFLQWQTAHLCDIDNV